LAVIQVVGTNSDWITPIEDCVYNHIKQQWLISDPPVTALDPDNKAWDNMGQFHLFVQRIETTGKREHGTQYFEYTSRLRIHCVMMRLTMGQLPNTMQNASTEVQRILWNYSLHWIAGIREFDDIREVVIDEPDTPANPFKNTYHIVIEVVAYYQKNSDFNIDTVPYDPSLYTAGQLTYL
jgi:hypothetical protein